MSKMMLMAALLVALLTGAFAQVATLSGNPEQIPAVDGKVSVPTGSKPMATLPTPVAAATTAKHGHRSQPHFRHDNHGKVKDYIKSWNPASVSFVRKHVEAKIAKAMAEAKIAATKKNQNTGAAGVSADEADREPAPKPEKKQESNPMVVIACVIGFVIIAIGVMALIANQNIKIVEAQTKANADKAEAAKAAAEEKEAARLERERLAREDRIERERLAAAERAERRELATAALGTQFRQAETGLVETSANIPGVGIFHNRSDQRPAGTPTTPATGAVSDPAWVMNLAATQAYLQSNQVQVGP